MIYTPITKKAINLMFEKHKDQKDKSGLPYVFHPFTVAESMTNELSTTTALLHDIVEDTDVTFEDLEKMNFPNEVINALKLLTHDESVPYDEYVKQIANNPIAREVKMSDLRHNMDIDRLNEVSEKDIERLEKYKRAYMYLEEHQPKERDIFKDSLDGFIVGDALGVPVEFLNRDELARKPLTDMVGYGSHKVPLGTWSDDTSMTIAEMDSIREKNKIDYFDMMGKFVQWMNNSKYTATGVFFDIGITTRRSLYRYMQGYDPIDCGGKDLSDNGNGSLMRILPFVIYSYENNLDEKEEVDLIHDASSLTHGHEISQLGCKIYSDIMKNLFDRKTVSEALEFVENKDYSEYYSQESIDYYKRILDGSIKELDEKDINSGGFVVSTLEASLWSLYNSNDYQSAVLKSINLGNDTDTVGAITGSLAGACYGNIPEKWLNSIKNKELSDSIYEGYKESIKKNEELEENSIMKH